MPVIPATLAETGDRAGLDTAYAAMVAGCRFLIARGAAPAGPALPLRPLVRLRMAGNGLKELDRFLAILIDECARASGRDPEARGPRTPATDTAARLHRLGPGAVWAACLPRLRAVERVRAAACGEPVLASWHRLGRDLAMASAGVSARPERAPAGPAISDQAMAEIAAFYLALAQALGRAHGVSPARP